MLKTTKKQLRHSKKKRETRKKKLYNKSKTIKKRKHLNLQNKSLKKQRGGVEPLAIRREDGGDTDRTRVHGIGFPRKDLWRFHHAGW